MAHRDLHGGAGHPGDFSFVVDLLSTKAAVQASKEVQSNKYEHDKQDDI